jgi:hypothetical protein
MPGRTRNSRDDRVVWISELRAYVRFGLVMEEAKAGAKWAVSARRAKKSQPKRKGAAKVGGLKEAKK